MTRVSFPFFCVLLVVASSSSSVLTLVQGYVPTRMFEEGNAFQAASPNNPSGGGGGGSMTTAVESCHGYFHRRRFQAAAQCYELAWKRLRQPSPATLTASPSPVLSVEYLTLAGRAWYEAKLYNQSVTCFQRAWDIVQGVRDRGGSGGLTSEVQPYLIALNLALGYAHLGRHARVAWYAQTSLRAAAGRRRGRPPTSKYELACLVLPLADVYFQRENCSRRTLTYLKQGLEFTRFRPDYWNLLGYCYLQTRHLARAVYALEMAVLYGSHEQILQVEPAVVAMVTSGESLALYYHNLGTAVYQFTALGVDRLCPANAYADLRDYSNATEILRSLLSPSPSSSVPQYSDPTGGYHNLLAVMLQAEWVDWRRSVTQDLFSPTTSLLRPSPLEPPESADRAKAIGYASAWWATPMLVRRRDRRGSRGGELEEEREEQEAMEEMEHHFKKAIECNRSQPVFHFNLGNFYASQQQQQRSRHHRTRSLLSPQKLALQYYRNAIVLAPGVAEYRYALALAFMEAGQLHLAAEQFESAIRRARPLSAESSSSRSFSAYYFQLGRCRFALRQFPEAAAAFEASLAATTPAAGGGGGDTLNLRNWLATAYYEMGQYPTAESVFTSATALDDTLQSYHYTLNGVLYTPTLATSSRPVTEADLQKPGNSSSSAKGVVDSGEDPEDDDDDSGAWSWW